MGMLCASPFVSFVGMRLCPCGIDFRELTSVCPLRWRILVVFCVLKSSFFWASLQWAGLSAGFDCHRFSLLFGFVGHWRLALTDAGRRLTKLGFRLLCESVLLFALRVDLDASGFSSF